MAHTGFTHEKVVSNTTTWLTPKYIYEAVGPFDLDPCAHAKNNTAKRKIILPEDGLLAEWQGRVWLNPPYGKGIGTWLEKLSNHGDGMAFVFARTSTKWFQNAIRNAQAIHFFDKRINCMKEDLSISTGAPADNVLLAYGNACANALMECSLGGFKIDLRLVRPTEATKEK